MDADVTFEDALVESLGRSVAAVVEHGINGQPEAQKRLLGPMLAAGTATVVVTIRMEPFRVIGVVEATDPAKRQEPIQLFRIEGGDEPEPPA